MRCTHLPPKSGSPAGAATGRPSRRASAIRQFGIAIGIVGKATKACRPINLPACRGTRGSAL
jgi:hypothetical protein